MSINMQAEKTPMPTQAPDVRNHNFKEVALGYTEEQAINEAKRCLQCKKPLCVTGCPVGIPIPQFIAKVAEGDFRGAFDIISSANALPRISGRVCPQETQCEGKCVRGIKNEPVAIGRLERFVADWAAEHAADIICVDPQNGHKAAVIGSGPAGVSAALYTARAGVDTTVLTRGPGALDRAELIQNYYGFAAPISGAELERQGIEGAKAVGVKFVTTEAVGLTYIDKLTVETLNGDYPADAVILATGASRATPRIPGLAGLEGHGVSYCATCDAFFYRGRDVAVVGSGEYALHEVQALLPVASSVTLLLNGAPPAAEFPPEVTVRPEKIDAILGEQKVTGVQLSGGDVVELAGVFVALGVAGSTALARKIGAAVENDRIVTDEKMQTTVPGLYAAGDCTGGLLQVAKAVYEGALAGTEAAKALRKR